MSTYTLLAFIQRYQKSGEVCERSVTLVIISSSSHSGFHPGWFVLAAAGLSLGLIHVECDACSQDAAPLRRRSPAIRDNIRRLRSLVFR